ncbi:MAG: heavy metal translocating P-type ATPase [Propionibacteriaceae bacterium]|nr:heavy metal translocating P-type ATPase [Propionibacteriaceae bacterium]
MGLALAAGAAYGAGLVLEHLIGAARPGPALAYVVACLCGGWLTARQAWGSLRRGRFEVDSLMLLAAVGAVAVGRLAEGAVLLFLFSLGHALEELAMARASRSIAALGQLAPRTAWLKTGPKTHRERPVERLRPGDVVSVRPHSRVPADGLVLTGRTVIDQSAVTGESIPVEKRPWPQAVALVADPSVLDGPTGAFDRADAMEADRSIDPGAAPKSARAFAGTVNGPAAFELVVTAAAQDSTLARVASLIEQAEAGQSPTQTRIKRVERVYVPVVLAAVAVICLIGWIGLGQAFGVSFHRAMVVLVAASPCALAISTPAALVSAIARAARAGALVKGGAALEALGRVQAMAFDKTGTLTWGQPQLTDVVVAAGVERPELVETVWAVEALSDHPLAQAVRHGLASQIRGDQVPSDRVSSGQGPVGPVSSGQGPVDPGASGRLGAGGPSSGPPLTGRILPVTGLEAVPGRGLRAWIGPDPVLVGSPRWLNESGRPLSDDLAQAAAGLQAQGRTVMAVRRGQTDLGLIGLMDSPRRESAVTLQALRQGGVGELVLLSGDNQTVAEAVGRAVGVDRALGGLLPQDKVAVIRQLGASGRVTGMVGDGVNDAPALAQADLGLAMGAAGSTVALEAADIALMSDDLGRVPFLRRLAQATSRLVRQNLILALAVVAVLAPLALLDLSIGPVVLIHEGSTLLVVCNGLRLLRFEPGGDHADIEHEDRPVMTLARLARPTDSVVQQVT